MERVSMGHGHSHGVTATGRHRRALVGALAAGLAIFVVEVVGAFVTGSLALLADAGHVLADAGVSRSRSARPSSPRGPRAAGARSAVARAEILAAAANGVVLAGMGIYVLVEGIRRLVHPAAVHAGGMALFAAIGLAGNLVALAFLYRARAASLNMRGAFLEVATDTATSVGVLAAAAVIALTGFTRADALVSVVIGAVILPRAVRLLREAANILLEAAPSDVDLDEIRRHIRAWSTSATSTISTSTRSPRACRCSPPTWSSTMNASTAATPRRCSTRCRSAWPAISTSSTPPSSWNRAATPTTSISSTPELPSA
jgi:cobalt-zinc-cadmium efflux system protein